MRVIVYFVIYAVIVLDFLNHLKRGRERALKLLCLPVGIAAAAAFVFVALHVLAGEVWQAQRYFFMIGVLPLYLLRRTRLEREESDAFPVRYRTLDRDEGAPAIEDSQKTILLSDAYGVVLFWVFVLMILSEMMGFFFAVFPIDISELAVLIFTAVLSFTVLLILIQRSTSKFSSRGFVDNVGLRRFGLPLWKIAALPALVGVVCAAVSAYIISTRDVQPPTPLGEVVRHTESPAVLIIFILVAILVAPLAEEIIFRGYFYRVLEVVKGRPFAVCAIALIFAVLHVGQYWGDWMAIGMVAVVGFALTLFRAWSGSTIASAVLHYTYNAGVIIFPFIILGLTNAAYLRYHVDFHQLSNEEKIALLEESVSNDPDLADALNDLAWWYAQEGVNLPRALELVNRALEARPDHLGYLDTKSAVLREMGRIEEAKRVDARIQEIQHGQR